MQANYLEMRNIVLCVLFFLTSILAYSADVAPHIDLYNDINSVEKQGDIMVVGGFKSSDYKGAVYVYQNVNNTWDKIAILSSSVNNEADDDWFGYSIALTETTIVVGAPKAGKVYVFEKPETGWEDMTESAVLSTPYQRGDHFGYSVAIGANEIAVGAYQAYNYQGRIALYQKLENEKWSEQNTTLTTLLSASPTTNEYVGHEIVLQGTTLVTGALGYSSWNGALFVYDITAEKTVEGTLLPMAKLTASSPDYQLGIHLAISEDQNTIAATEYGRSKAGSVRMFVKSDTEAWSDRTEKFNISENDIVNGDLFGSALNFNENRIAISAREKNNGQGKVYEYSIADDKPSVSLINTYEAHDAEEGHLFGKELCYFGEGKLIVAAPSKENDKLYFFGDQEGPFNREYYTKSRHIDIDGNYMVMGAYDGDHSGVAFVYHFENEMWVEVAMLVPSDGQKGDMFGFAVAIQGDVIVVGAPNAEKTYVFEKSSTETWKSMKETRALSPINKGYFGYSVDVQDKTILVGAYQTNNYQGSAYLYRRDGATWSDDLTVHNLTSPSPQVNEYYGHVLKIEGNTIAIGALGNNNWKGTVYVYNIPPNGELDLNTPPVDLSVSNDGEDYQFGIHFDLNQNTIAVTDYGRDVNGNVYVYQREEGKLWTDRTESYVIENPNPADGSGFGSAIHIKGDTLAIGSYGDNKIGSAHVYQLTDYNARWIFNYQLERGEENDLFGADLKLMENHLVVLAGNRKGDFLHTFTLPTISAVTSIKDQDLIAIPKLLNTDPVLRHVSRILQFVDLQSKHYSYSVIGVDGKLLQKGELNSKRQIELETEGAHFIIQLIESKSKTKYTFRY
ncbi:FG-GAP repeat protein [Flammeovirga sp. SJP92]|uniref:FG-GAP repeat protein n=1 Tax=Flammeovirga sp. SJP92 TaxID=1775430 RepID=UPI0007880ECE|nr:FG-GAP repeat protein [Flammeovirga sp. SJP92]KXX67289.1 hypothetical protein AVL50_28300 [Flammeovirga sp. SJP92]